MNIQPEFEREKDGRWIAMLPGFREVFGHGSTRHEAAVGLTVRALNVLADRVKTHRPAKVEDEPIGILLASAEGDELSQMLIELVFGLEGGHTPNAETIAAFEEYERNGGESFEDFDDLIAKLNAD